MHRIDQDGHSSNLFQEGDPELGQPATRVGADWLNAVQEELANAIEAVGVPLDKNDNEQLAGILVDHKERIEDAEDALEDLAPRIGPQGEWLYPTPKVRVVLVPHNAWSARAGAWARELDLTWKSEAEGTRLLLHVGSLLPNGADLYGIQLLVKPGRGRTGTDRMRATIYALAPNFDAPAIPTPGTPAGLSASVTVYSTDTTAAQLLELTAGSPGWGAGQSIVINRETQDVIVAVESGIGDGGTHQGDLLIAARFFVREAGPRGI